MAAIGAPELPGDNGRNRIGDVQDIPGQPVRRDWSPREQIRRILDDAGRTRLTLELQDELSRLRQECGQLRRTTSITVHVDIGAQSS